MTEIISNTQLIHEIVEYEPFWYTEPDIKRALELRFIKALPFDQLPLTQIPEADQLFRIECKRFREAVERKGWRFY